ncbi:SET domain-containing protein-lysine N-methyltransferase [Sphingomonas sp. MA1305]|uniref:SET domain-containing protein n=1 Tax=Sphingomonas sp. MA1305 TaxID=2479204 RepID=UPI0018DF175D|nr:SET domain-containing protein [Sphingomonas sp. MA1305]MBI0476645.1 SET domain-containing protein-lysine N-methyltransferase [Sphingomonas sp. MA1305]
MTVEPWFIVAMVLSLAGYCLYLAGLRRHLVEPSRASWLIWAVATGVEAATYLAVNPGKPQGLVFIFSAVACIIITLAMWQRSRWTRPSPTEAICMAASLAAVVLWLPLQETFWAHMLVVAAVPLGFWPTWASVVEDRARERSPAWGLWTLGDLATLVVAVRTHGLGIGGYAYILVELTCHASVWVMVGLDTIDPRQALSVRSRGQKLLDAYVPANPFTIGTTHLGKAVFAARAFAEGEELTRFSGRRVAASRVPRALNGARDRFLQIARDRYMGPSGRIDDLINHSCAPNAGLRFEREGVVLVALTPIAPNEEICWDYSTTLDDPDWSMECRCGTATCRGTIGAFATLPVERQIWYRLRGVVAPYLVETVEPGRERAA